MSDRLHGVYGLGLPGGLTKPKFSDEETEIIHEKINMIFHELADKPVIKEIDIELIEKVIKVFYHELAISNAELSRKPELSRKIRALDSLYDKLCGMRAEFSNQLNRKQNEEKQNNRMKP